MSATFDTGPSADANKTSSIPKSAGDGGDSGDTDHKSLINREILDDTPVSGDQSVGGDSGDSAAEADPFRPLGDGPAGGGQQNAGDDDILEPMPYLGDAVTPSMFRHHRHGDPASAFGYRDAEGRLIAVAARYHLTGTDGEASKAVLPWAYGRRRWLDKAGNRRDGVGWHLKAMPTPRGLYGLEKLAQQPAAAVLIVEGEKAADAAQALFPSMVAVTSMGGSKAAAKSDWTPLAGRHVIIWPDCDEPGAAYAQDVASLATKAGVSSVRIVDVPGHWPKGWDLADSPPEGVSAEDLHRMVEEAPDPAPPVKMPPKFSLTGGGLFFQPAPKPDGRDSPRVWVCGPFTVLGETRTSEGEDWGLLIQWKDSEGRPHQWSIPRRMIHGQGASISEELESSGLSCSPDRVAHDLLKRFIGGVQPGRKIRCVDRGGWHAGDDGQCFILPNGEAFGSRTGGVVLQGARTPTNHAFALSGTMNDWRDRVAAPCDGNDRLVLYVAASLAAPLLHIVGEPSGGVHLVGPSRCGKSTAMLIAGSVWGSPTADGQLRTWRGTSNGLEGIAATLCDLPLLLDELGQADARDADSVVYMLSNESGKQRAGRTGAARQRASWRSLFLSTGEVTLAAKLGESGRRAMAGLEARLLNLPADAGAGMGIFQTLHGHESPGRLAENLRAATLSHHGHAGRAFLGQLVSALAAGSDTLVQTIKTGINAFVNEHVPAGASGQIASAARRLALCAMAGEMAIDAGILPWQRGEALRACGACFNAWLAERGGFQSGEDVEALAAVRRFIESHGASRFTPFPTTDDAGLYDKTINRAGWRRAVQSQDGEVIEYLVLPQQWKAEVCRGLDPKAVARLLHQRGFLIGATPGHHAAEVRVPGAGKLRLYLVSGRILAGDADGV